VPVATFPSRATRHYRGARPQPELMRVVVLHGLVGVKAVDMKQIDGNVVKVNVCLVELRPDQGGE